MWFLIKIPTLQWRAVHFTFKSAVVSYLQWYHICNGIRVNHTPC